MNCAPISSSIRSTLTSPKKFQEGTRTTLEALDQKVGLDTVKSMQGWPSDVVSVGSQRNEALLQKLEDASEEISDREDHDANCVHDTRR